MSSQTLRPATVFRGSVSSVRAIESCLDPMVIIFWLLAMGNALNQGLDAHAVISVVMVFGLTFPGNVKFTDALPTVVFKCVVTALAVVGGLTLLSYASGGFEGVSREQALPWFAALPVVLFGGHLLTRVLVRQFFTLSQLQSTVVVCGVNDIGAALAAQFQLNPFHGVNFVGFFDDRNRERMSQLGQQALLGSFDELGDFVRRHRVDRIYMALPMATQPRIVKMLEDLKDSTASIYFVPDIFVTEVINGRFESVAGMPVVAVRDTPFASVVNSAIKRLEDIVLASLSVVIAAPLLAVIAIGVRLSSPGVAVFAQRRYGLDGREIFIYKFRTMTVVEDGDTEFTAVKMDDARVTRFGQFLRRTSLDELPQLINVLQGRMSLVGPRPHAVAMNEQYRKLIPGYMLRHKIKPGITGLAQIRGFRGGSDLDQMQKRIASDLEYMRNWTLGMDLWILARTPLVLLGDQKAY